MNERAAPDAEPGVARASPRAARIARAFDQARSALPVSLAALAAGAVCTFAFAPFELFWIAPIALAALLALIDSAPSRRAAAWRGFAFGLGYFLGGVSWVYVSLNVYGSMPLPLAALATLGFCAYLALFPALCAWAAKAATAGVARVLAFAACWVLTDWLRGWLFTGFSWQAIGYSQASASALAGWAPVAGVHSITLVVALSGAGLWFACQAAAGRRPRPAALAIAAIAALWISGALLARVQWTAPSGEPIEVALLQGNIAQDMKWREDRLATTLETYWRMIEAVEGAQLVVLPETALPVLSDRLPEDYLARLVARARAQRADILIGLVERAGNGRNYYNSVFSVGTAPVQVYRKQHLVPFGEFIPPLFDWVMQWLNIPLQDFSRGAADQVPMELSGQRVAVNICYEDAFGEEIIRQLPAASILVNVSNTAWFGRSAAQPQHLQISRMRALETGRPMLRSTNTGMTAVIDPRGRVLVVAEPFTETTVRATVQGYQGVTPFVRVGNYGAIGLALIIGAVGATLSFRRRREAGRLAA